MNGTEFVLILLLVAFAISVFVTTVLRMRKGKYDDLVRLGYIVFSYMALVGTSYYIARPNGYAFMICILLAIFSIIKVIYDATVEKYMSDFLAIIIVAFEVIAPVIAAITLVSNITSVMTN